MKRIAVINQKGGVGKTTTTANLGAALGRAGYSVLLIDLDAQTNLTLHLTPFGEPEIDGAAPAGAAGEDEVPTIFDVLVDTDRVALATAIVDRPAEKIELVRASQDLAGIEQALASKIGRELLLRDALEAVARAGKSFDFVLMDCPPSLGVLSLNALSAADSVLIPLQTEFFALQGLSQLFEVVQVVQQRLNPDLEIIGILPCLVDQRTRLSAEVIGEISEHFGELLLETRIRKSVRLAEAPGFGQSIFSYAPGTPGAEDYEQLTRELLARLGVIVPETVAKAAAETAIDGSVVDTLAELVEPSVASPRDVVSHEPTPATTSRGTGIETPVQPRTEPGPEPATTSLDPSVTEPPRVVDEPIGPEPALEQRRAFSTFPIAARLAEDGLAEAGMVADLLAGTETEGPVAPVIGPPKAGLDTRAPLRPPLAGPPARADAKIPAPPATGGE